ncbi:VOC family protein [Paenibacillus sp. NPDC057967]|uniref:VOC family protein n=1 Tax=Paenibacillus sp. NPDC057967 TaxID=3346293 RepID=UPI0036DCAF05
MQKITTFLWFNQEAEEAINFYTSIFPNSAILSLVRNGNQVVTGTFQLEGQSFMALNGGPHYSFTPAISLFVSCESQEEVDELWDKLVEGGEESRCGWLKDRFGLSWQIIPKALGELMHGGGDAARAQRVMNAMLGMNRIIIEDLKRAYDGES